MEKLATERHNVDAVHDRLRGAILRGDIPPGEVLQQVALAEELGSQPHPLAKGAFRLLQREGLLEGSPNRSYRVTSFSPRDLEELYVTFLPLQALAIRLTIPRLQSADIATMMGDLAQMDHYAEVQDVEAWEVPHREFHRRLIQHAGRRVVELLDRLSDHAGRYRRVYLAGTSYGFEAAAAEHRELLGPAARATRTLPPPGSPTTSRTPRSTCSRWPTTPTSRRRSRSRSRSPSCPCRTAAEASGPPGRRASTFYASREETRRSTRERPRGRRFGGRGADVPSCRACTTSRSRATSSSPRWTAARCCWTSTGRSSRTTCPPSSCCTVARGCSAIARCTPPSASSPWCAVGSRWRARATASPTWRRTRRSCTTSRRRSGGCARTRPSTG